MALTDEQKIIHFLSRASFGPTAAEIERVKAKGIPAYLEEQLEPEAIPDPIAEEKLKDLKTLNLRGEELLELYPPQQQAQAKGMTPEQSPRNVILELQRAKLLRAVYSARQLQEVLVDFWLNHFNVFAAKGVDRWLVTEYERDTIRPRALGRFRDLLLATAQSPAMLFYLDNWLSASPDAPANRLRNSNAAFRKAGLNENYARELMELHTLGVNGGYSQKDVGEVARCFTGWTIRQPRGRPEFIFDSRMHDRREKTVLGSAIAAGGGMEDGIKVIDLLAGHPSTASFIATKLVRRFVRDDPPAGLVPRIAEVFRQSGGDIRAILRAIFAAQEFFSPETVGVKMKKPLELVASALRTAGGETDAAPPILRHLAGMGEPLFLSVPPTGFPDVSSTWSSPDMLLARINFAVDLTTNRIRGTRIRPGGISALALAAPEFQQR